MQRTDQPPPAQINKDQQHVQACHRCGGRGNRCDEAKHRLASLRSLESARRAAFEAQELERWDGLS